MADPLPTGLLVCIGAINSNRPFASSRRPRSPPPQHHHPRPAQEADEIFRLLEPNVQVNGVDVTKEPTAAEGDHDRARAARNASEQR